VEPRRAPQAPDREAHARALVEGLRRATTGAADQRPLAIHVQGAQRGFYVEFESQPEYGLKLESLENRTKKIELVSVSQVKEDGTSRQRAVVFVPEGQVTHFESRFLEYATENSKGGRPRHADLVNAIAALRSGTVRALWTDDPDTFPPEGERIWWEVWLRRTDGAEADRLADFARHVGIELRDHRLAFPDRTVLLALATAEQLAQSLEVLDSIAELRRAKDSPGFFLDLRAPEQARWADDLRGRTEPPAEDAPAVCILDTGVNRGHPLLERPLEAADMHACVAGWGTADHDRHGTEMAGLAQYGDLKGALASADPVRLVHRLESVKILPPAGANPPDLWGTRTAEAASRVEVRAPTRRRCFSMAVTARDSRDRGRPTSWSAAVDALAAGRSFNSLSSGLEYLDDGPGDVRRLYLVSAGNMATLDPATDHLDASDAESVHDPGQAWNAVTVGAHTELAAIDGADPGLAGWTPMAPPGQLSPHSTTSVPFDSQWPIKPEIVFEGGNVAVSPDATSTNPGVPSLALLTTHWLPNDRLFTITCATSAATAQVAHIAGEILAAYPDFWPETVRALIVHSAEWTPPMRDLLLVPRFRDRERLLRRYGHGVPSAARAIRSATNALTLVVQSTIRPFEHGRMREMNLHELPWPRQVLEDLGETRVRMRVTLSHFIEPNPARRGWRGRYRYASHGLRFDLKRPAETIRDFRRRLNQKARAEEEGDPPAAVGADTGWLFGEQTRIKGSLHQDTWTGTAADLAARGVVGVFPISGWWKDQPKRDRSERGVRYALVVSIETEREDVDIYTAVATQVGVPIDIDT